MSQFTYQVMPISGSIAATQAAAEVNFSNAKIIADGGRGEAREFALGWMDHFKPSHWTRGNDNDRAAILSRFTSDVLTAATRIASDGRPWYWGGDNSHMLICCTLMADASSGATGYLPTRSRAA